MHGPDELWVADITFVAIGTGFVYLAVVLDAWSRRVVGYALDRHLDARPATAALRAALLACRPPVGRCPDACSTPTAACSAAPGRIARCSRRMASSAR